MTSFKTSLLTATVVAVPIALQAPAAQAQPVNGLYVSAGAGVNFLQGTSIHEFDPAEYQRDDIGTAKARLGFAGVASIGWGFGNGLRAEIEGSWRDNLLHGTVRDTLYPGSDSVRGRQSVYGAMVNALYDFDIGANWVYPYIGAGVGYAWRQPHGFGIIPDEVSNDTRGNLAYQAIAGLAFPVASVPGLSITAEYRYFGMLDTTHNTNEPLTRWYFDNHSDNHSILLGVRYAFNAAPAAVVAAPPAVAPAGKSFLVFFDWDKSTLTARARGIIKEAAMASKSMKHTVIDVNGYADTSGNPKYNMGLSMRRAQTVAAELVRNGVAKQEIAIKAFGDTVLLVPTGPGVREPQNRRVEIIIK